jgi:hypothetical protein
MVALALHEGIPGHHHQGSLSVENETLPKLLRTFEDRRYEYCPAKRNTYSSYIEVFIVLQLIDNCLICACIFFNVCLCNISMQYIYAFIYFMY